MRFSFIVELREGETPSAAALSKLAHDVWPTSQRILHRLGASPLARPQKVESQLPKDHWHSGMPMPAFVTVSFGGSHLDRLTTHWCEVCRPAIEAKLSEKHGMLRRRPAAVIKKDFESWVQLRGKHFYVLRHDGRLRLFEGDAELPLSELRPEEARAVESSMQDGCACVLCSKR